MGAIGGLSVEDDKKVTEISSFRTIRDVLFWYAPYNLPNCVRQITCPKEHANGGTHGSPLDPPSFRRPHSGRTGLKGQFFYSNEVATTRTGEKVA